MDCTRHSKMAWLLIVATVLTFSACSGGKKARVSRTRPINIYELKSSALPRFDIPVEVNDRVIAWIEYFQGPGRRHFEKYLRRSGRYAPMIREILKDENVPQDLVYISMIESGFSPHAYSRASAVGFWQFIRSTGKIYGLDINQWVDERRDLEKSTRAAAHFFRDLHRDYGDWYLAMVGYNAGPRRVEQAIGITRSRDFWDMAAHRSALRAETRDYVPKFIAAAIISKMPERFGFDDIQYESPLEFDTVSIDTQTDMSVIAECAGTDQGTIAELNPHLHSGVTPPAGDYEVRIPKGSSGAFKIAYVKVPKEERVRIVRYKVRKGDTLHRVARRFGVDPNALAEANGIRPKKGLRRGTMLTIPAKGTSAKMLAYASAENEPGSPSRTKKIVHHRVAAGETVSGIANRYGVKASQVMAWNHLNRKAMLRKGQKLKIYKAVAAAEPIPSIEKEKKIESTGVDLAGMENKSLSTEASVPNQSTDGDAIQHVDAVGGSSAAKTGITKGFVENEYVVKPGETIGSIARKHGVKTAELMAWNGIADAARLRAGSRLKVYASKGGDVAAKLTSSKVESLSKGSTATSFYTVKPGETLGAIAGRHRVTVKQLMAWNRIKNPKLVKSGTKLKIMTSADRVAPKTAATAVPAEKIDDVPSGAPIKLSDARPVGKAPHVDNTYRVRQGDTLWDIARRHNVSISDIQAWNNLKDPSDVRPGTSLIIRQN